MSRLAPLRPAFSALALLAAVFAALCAPPSIARANGAEAQPYEWRNVTVGAGGFAPNIIFSRAEPGLAYLRTDMGGAYRWDARQNRWIPLQDGNPVGSHMGIESIAADPKNPEVVYLAAGMSRWGEAAIWRSQDRGTSWTVVEVPFKMGGNEPGRGLGERLAIDPHKTSTLLFGSRHDGLQRSDDGGRSWHKVSSFPHPGLGLPANPREAHGGISFVVFHPKRAGTIYAGVADPGERHLYRSTDGGKIWAAVPGGPRPEMLPVKADIDDRGNLYIGYATGIGPNDIADGAVWRLDTRSGKWSDITPDPASEGGYMGVSVDRQRAGRLAVSSVNRWHPGDTVWVSDDYGRTWDDLSKRSRRDTSISPYLDWGNEESEFGHWTTGLAIDPFDSGAIAYTTGATVYRTDEGDKPKGTMLWKPWVQGIEQTAVITMVSPTGGAPVISGFGDLAGFVHERLDVSPPHMHLEPRLYNTNNLDYAGLAPQIVVRSGTARPQFTHGASLAWSEDGGKNWQALRAPKLALGDEPARRYDLTGEAPINVSADGAVFIVGTPMALVTRDRGKSWSAPEGLPPGARAIADKVNPQLFYALDFAENQLFVSRDGARSFAPVPAKGLPPAFSSAAPRWRESQWPMQATPRRAGELWFKLDGELYHSSDAGQSFRRATPPEVRIQEFGLGHPAPGRALPALYAIAETGGVRGVFRSDDGGARWLRINDDAHQWGLRFRAISGDPRRYSRVYIATDGRGLLYGDPAKGEQQ